MAKLRKVQHNGHGPDYTFWCPGCECAHGIWTMKRGGTPNWEFNGREDKPTFSPSILVRYPNGATGKDEVCHSYVRDGQIQFLNDCTHKLAGQTVELPEND